MMHSVHPCDRKNNGGCQQTCLKTTGLNYKCACRKNFELEEDGKTCEKVHPCEVKNGGCSHLCEKKGAEARCACPEDFSLEEDMKSCEKGKNSLKFLLVYVQ